MRDIKKAIKDGKKVVGTFIWDFNVPFLPKMFANAGYDYVILDNEHGCFSYTDLQTMVQIAKGCDIATIVRVPKIDRECIQRYWDLGADGILVPMVNTKEQAMEVVRLSKYAPMGQKGMAFFKGNMDFRMDKDIKEYMEDSNKKGLILVQTETQESVGNIEEIAAVEGVDGVFVGPLDLSGDFGTPGTYDGDEFLAAVKKVFDTTKKQGKISACFVGNHQFLGEVLSYGVNFIAWGTDTIMFNSGITHALKKIKETKGFN